MDLRGNPTEALEREVQSALAEASVYDVSSYGWLNENDADPGFIGHAMWQIDPPSIDLKALLGETPVSRRPEDIEREILTAGEDFCGLMQAARLSIGLALLWQTQAHKDPWNEDAVCDLCLSPEVAIKPKNRDDTEIIEPDIAVCTLTDVVGHYAFAVIVCWRLCELARTCNVAATNVEPVAAHPPIGYVGHRRTPCARSATFGPEFPF